ncbi:unnamed protein product [Linum trigynum]|uniref:Retrotransposon gag domain-containing protein n=1 Tax=Linum trigynum TaxID=586398 RepID=A0AAV2DF53_9ROSI
MKPAIGEECSTWIRCDAMVKGWLKTSMDKEIHNNIHSAETAQAIWADLRERFGKGSSSRAYELQRLTSLLRKEKTFVSAFYTHLRSLWEEATAITPLPALLVAFARAMSVVVFVNIKSILRSSIF